MSKSKTICANLLKNGLVVYPTRSGDWTTDLAEAWIARTPAEEAQLTAVGSAAAKDNIVIDPILIDVDADAPRALSLRERIRATGPTVRPDLQRAVGAAPRVAAE